MRATTRPRRPRLELSPNQAVWLLIGLSGLCRIALAATLGPGNDESYHYLFTTHPDWSYFDHPPMLAWIELIGLGLSGGSASIFALRLGFIALFAGSTWLLARLTRKLLPDRPWAGFLASLGLNVTAYYGAAAGTFALPDGPLLFFWLLTLDRLAAVRENPDWLPGWCLVGVAWGCTLLSKYHGVFIPVAVLVYVLWEPTARCWLRKPGPYLAGILGIVAFSPVLIWNQRHGWASFAFQGGRAAGESGFRPSFLGLALVEQAVYLLPWVWWPLVVALAGSWRRLRNRDGGVDRFLFSLAAVPLVIFALIASRGRVLPHWSLIGFVAIFPLLGKAWADRLSLQPRRFKRVLATMSVVPVVLALILVAQVKWDLLLRLGLAKNELIARSADPTIDLRGWNEVARLIKDRGLLRDPDVFLVTTRWYQSGQLAFATGQTRAIACYNPWDARGFAYWSKREDWLGRDAILVTIDDMTTDPKHLRRWFDRVEPIAEIPLDRAGIRVRTFGIFRCVRQTRAYPFANVSPAEVKRKLLLAKDPRGREQTRRR